MTGDANRDLEVLFRIAHAVHSAVRESMTSPHRADVVAMGADGSPTEEIDRVAEARILACLEAEAVGWDLLSEEIGHVARGGERLLIADPIDGSHNALRGIPFATVSLALGRNNLDGVDIGVVHDLVTGQTFWAVRGGGAWRDGRRLHSRPLAGRPSLVLANLGVHATPRVPQFAARARRVRALGCASREILLVAEGGADAYMYENQPQNRNLRVTDIAAAYRILLEAGGGIGDAMGRPIGQITLDLSQHTSVLAWGDRALLSSQDAEAAP